MVGLGQPAQALRQHHQGRSRSGDPPWHRYQTHQGQARGLLQGSADLARVRLGYEPALPPLGWKSWT
jgi:hypothetical protein